MIKAIIFDLGDVYLKGFFGVEKYLAPILKIKIKDIQPRLQGKELISLFQGKISEEEYWNKMIKKNNWKADINKFKKAIRKNFEEIEGTRDIIEKLKKEKFKLGLLSDHCEDWIKHCNRKFNYHKLFHSILYSFEVNICKSNKKMFKLILDKLEEKANNCLFVDDRKGNIEVAKSLGINTILFKDAKQLKKDLIKLGVLR